LHFISITQKLSLRFYGNGRSYHEFIKIFENLKMLGIIGYSCLGEEELKNLFDSIPDTVEKIIFRKMHFTKIHFELMNDHPKLLMSPLSMVDCLFGLNFTDLASKRPELIKKIEFIKGIYDEITTIDFERIYSVIHLNHGVFI
jgi:hypothetical protein